MTDSHEERLAEAETATARDVARVQDAVDDAEARVLGSDAARAVGRFNPDGPLGYRAATAPDAPLRATRAEAEEDERRWRDA